MYAYIHNLLYCTLGFQVSVSLQLCIIMRCFICLRRYDTAYNTNSSLIRLLHLTAVVIYITYALYSDTELVHICVGQKTPERNM